MKREIYDRLLGLGLFPTLKGFYYMVDAIEIAISNGSSLTRVFDNVYKQISKKYNRSASSVERCLRYVVSKCKDKNLRLLSVSKFIAILSLNFVEDFS